MRAWTLTARAALTYVACCRSLGPVQGGLGLLNGLALPGREWDATAPVREAGAIADPCSSSQEVTTTTPSRGGADGWEDR